MKKKIAVLPGDGIGPEVTEQAIKVLDAVSELYDHHFDYCYCPVGAIAIDETGDPLPEETLNTCLSTDAILFGAIGHPRYDNDPTAPVRPEQGLLRLRKSLGLFANIRPVATYESLLHLSPLREDRVRGTDLVIYRELTGGIYFGEKGRNAARTEAYDHCNYADFEIERIARLAFANAMTRRRKLTLVDKANVLETSRLWREQVTQIAKDYPEVEFDTMFVDNAAMQLIQYPTRFDVILTENMFGDILSDEASVLPGSMGLLPSASIGEKTALFEPIHGSFPEATGQDIANPMAAILSAAMMLEHFGLNQEAAQIQKLVTKVLEAGIGTAEIKPEIVRSCSAIGDIIAFGILHPDNDFHLPKEKLKETASTII